MYPDNSPEHSKKAGESLAPPPARAEPPHDAPRPLHPAPVHRIRLRQPWQRQVMEHGTRWQRRFNRPSGLAATQRVWIVVAGIAAPGTAALNGQVVGTLSGQAYRPAAFDVTDKLRPHNQLELLLEATAPAGLASQNTPGQVWIEIRGPSTPASDR